MPAYPFLGLLAALGASEVLAKVRRSFIAGLLVIVLVGTIPLGRSQKTYRHGERRAEKTTAALAKKIPPDAVVFCEDLTGPLRLYAGLAGYRFMATDDATLLETVRILNSFDRPVFFFLDVPPAEEHFERLLGRNPGFRTALRYVGRIRGCRLYRFAPEEQAGKPVSVRNSNSP